MPCPVQGTKKTSLFLTGSPGVGKTTLLRTVLHRLVSKPNPPDLSGFLITEVRSSPTGSRLGFDACDIATGRSEPLARLDDSAEARGPDYGPRVGRYRVRARAFDEFALASLTAPVENLPAVNGILSEDNILCRGSKRSSRRVPKLYVVDEVGAFESHSPLFARRLRQLLDGSCNGTASGTDASTGSYPTVTCSRDKYSPQPYGHPVVTTSTPQSPPPSKNIGGVVFGTVALKSGGALAGEIRARKDIYLVEVTRTNRDRLVEEMVNLLLAMLMESLSDTEE